MGEIRSSGTFEAGCQHVNLTCELTTGKTPTENTSLAQIGQFRCADCGVSLYPIGANGKPSEFIRVPLVTTSPEEKPARAPKKTPDPSLAKSRINRKGLPPGTPAPEFSLPRLDGGAAVALADYRGRQVLIVFIGSDCKYCDDVAPDIQRLHDSGFPVLAIGQKSEAAMREKVAGWTFPVVMQREWEVSKLYGRFALPVGNLIDESGVIVEEAVGTPALPSLIERLIVPLTAQPVDAAQL